MHGKYRQNTAVSGVTRFTKSPMANVEFSRMVADPTWLLTFNAGDIVPVYCAEVLPHDTFDLSLDFDIRQSTCLKPVMGQMQVDYYAFFVPNRIINESWKNVQGENTSGFWTAPEVTLAPLYVPTGETDTGIQIQVGSIADYYGLPTQGKLPAKLLAMMNDLKFRGYFEIYNNYFRDQNYQPPISYSKLNIYNGFLQPFGSTVNVDGSSTVNGGYTVQTGSEPKPTGSFPDGAIVKALYGDGLLGHGEVSVGPRSVGYSINQPPLKANKLHDAFTSVLPSPQKGADVFFGVGTSADVVGADDLHDMRNAIQMTNGALPTTYGEKLFTALFEGKPLVFKESISDNEGAVSSDAGAITRSNLVADLTKATGVSVNDLRLAVATQQVYETLARGGSRYLSTLRSFFEIETENPFSDIPVQLGHIRRELDLYQVAQTSQSASGGTPQANLAAFGYTASGGHLFNKTFLEHGYIHVFAVVRQRNIYPAYLSLDNFRLSTLDFYLPQFANIGEQPVPTYCVNPFAAADVYGDVTEKVLGYQEAWWEYRTEPDRVHGYFRTGITGSLSPWTYADNADSLFTHVNGDWLKSNAKEVMDRTLAVTSTVAPQFLGKFHWRVEKNRPMPTYSVPGLDII